MLLHLCRALRLAPEALSGGNVIHPPVRLDSVASVSDRTGPRTMQFSQPRTLSELLAQADTQAPAPERHLWLIHLLNWLRQPGPPSPYTPGDWPDPVEYSPWPVRRLRHLLDVLEQRPQDRLHISALLRHTLSRLDATGLLADYGFAPRQGFVSELAERMRLVCLPGTPQTNDLGELFHLLLSRSDDMAWLSALDPATVERMVALCSTPKAGTNPPWQASAIESIQLLASQMRAGGLSPAMRQRMDRGLLASQPFHRVVQAAEALRDNSDLPACAQTLRDVLHACCTAADSVRSHLDEHGISVDLVFQVDQIHSRGRRIDILLDTLTASPETSAAALRALVLHLVQAGQERRSVRALFTQHYGLLARKVTERSAETGGHYITRDLVEYRTMLREASGGGAIIGLTTLMKFAIGAFSLPVFWFGFWAGVNYAVSFVVVQLLHLTVATKQPAMTAPTLAAKLEDVGRTDAANPAAQETIDSFVDEVAHLLRSQIAGIVGNLLLVMPVVLLAQGLTWLLTTQPLIGADSGHYVLHSLTLLGPTALFAAFTGVLLFASSLIAGWVENWFVYHRLDSAIAWNPRSIAVLGPRRAQRWAHWWRHNISGLAANVSLGMMLGVIPAVCSFVGLPLEVRHVTLAAGQLAAAIGALGTGIFQQPDFWWCVAAIPVIGLLNLGVSFSLAFKVALASRGLRVQERGRLYAALGERWRKHPRSFFLPPRATPDAPGN